MLLDAVFIHDHTSQVYLYWSSSLSPIQPFSCNTTLGFPMSDRRFTALRMCRLPGLPEAIVQARTGDFHSDYRCISYKFTQPQSLSFTPDEATCDGGVTCRSGAWCLEYFYGIRETCWILITGICYVLS